MVLAACQTYRFVWFICSSAYRATMQDVMTTFAPVPSYPRMPERDGEADVQLLL